MSKELKNIQLALKEAKKEFKMLEGLVLVDPSHLVHAYHDIWTESNIINKNLDSLIDNVNGTSDMLHDLAGDLYVFRRRLSAAKNELDKD